MVCYFWISLFEFWLLVLGLGVNRLLYKCVFWAGLETLLGCPLVVHAASHCLRGRCSFQIWGCLSGKKKRFYNSDHVHEFLDPPLASTLYTFFSNWSFFLSIWRANYQKHSTPSHPNLLVISPPLRGWGLAHFFSDTRAANHYFFSNCRWCIITGLPIRSEESGQNQTLYIS